MYCTKCGKLLEDTVSFCKHCGAKLDDTVKSGFKKGWLWIGGGAALLIAVILLIIGVKSNDLSETIEGQLNAIRGNKLTEAYYGYTSEKFQNYNSFEKFKEFVRSLPILHEFTGLTIGNASTEDDIGTVKAILEKNNEVEGEMVYHLIKQEDKWRVLDIEFIEYQPEKNPEQENATKALIAPIEDLLKDLKANDLLKGYQDTTTKTFKQKLTYDQFKAFVQANPILNTYQSYDFKEHYTEDEKGLVTVILNPENNPVTIQYGLEKENGQWKIFGMTLHLPATPKGEAVVTNPAGMITTIRQQLEAFQQNNVEKAYYNFLSKNLQNETPLGNFRSFVLSYPAFLNHKTVNITEPYVEDGIGRVDVDLINDQGVTHVEYALAQQNNEWKVVGIHVVKTTDKTASELEGDIKNFKTRDLINVVQAFLSALRDKDIAKAYKDYTSQKFKEENSLTTFEDFVKKHPELIKSTSSSFEKLMFNNNIATISGELFHSESISLPMEFDLIREDNKWRILHIFTMPAIDHAAVNPPKDGKQAAATPMEFTKILLGSKISNEGLVIDPATIFKPDAGDIYVNLYVSNGIQGTEIEVLFRHVESGSNIPPVKGTVADNGDSVLSFVFSPPPGGWPKGSYQIKASAKNEVFKTFTFRVE